MGLFKVYAFSTRIYMLAASAKILHKQEIRNLTAHFKTLTPLIKVPILKMFYVDKVKCFNAPKERKNTLKCCRLS
mgnify:CR=1 FL=1